MVIEAIYHMSQSTSKPPIHMSSKAEGEPDEHERLEPPTPLRTSTIPAISETAGLTASDTGLNYIVTLNTDGHEYNDKQDASLTIDERTLHSLPDTDAETSDMTSQSPILIVEDTVELAEVIQATLEAMGLESVYETHGKTALERLKELNPSLVLLDIGLPDISGWKMLDFIKDYANSTQKDTPTIIVITAYGDPANRLIGKLQNIHSYLVKPFTPDQVEQMVGMALRGEKPSDQQLGDEPSKTS